MEAKYDVSIIIPTWNVSKRTDGEGKPTIFNTIDTINNQVHENFSLETIFVDDLSTDDTAKIISSFIQKYPNINGKLFRLTEKAGSPYVGWNKGIDEASGIYVMFADTDDFFGVKGSLYDMFLHAMEWNSDVVSGKLGNAGRGASNQQFRFGNMPKTNFDLSNPMSPFSTFGRLFRLQVLKQLNIRYVEDIVPRADMDFLANVYLKDQLRTSVYADNVVYSWNQPEQNTLSETMRKEPDFLSKRRLQDTRIIKKIAESKSKNNVVKAGILNKTVKGIGFRAFFSKEEDCHVQHSQKTSFFEVKNALKNILDEGVIPYLDRETELVTSAFIKYGYYEAKKIFENIKEYMQLNQKVEIFINNSLQTPESLLNVVEQVTQYKLILGNQTFGHSIRLIDKIGFTDLNSLSIAGHVGLLLKNRGDNKRFYMELGLENQTIDFSRTLMNFDTGEKVDMFWKIENHQSIIMMPLQMSDFKSIENPRYKIFENYLGNVTIKKVQVR